MSRAPFFPNVFTIYNNVIDERIRYSFFCFYACRITCTYSLSDVMSFCIYAWEATICLAYCKLQHVSLCSFLIIGVCTRILRIYMHAYMSVMRTISMCSCWVVCYVHNSYTCLWTCLYTSCQGKSSRSNNENGRTQTHTLQVIYHIVTCHIAKLPTVALGGTRHVARLCMETWHLFSAPHSLAIY